MCPTVAGSDDPREKASADALVKHLSATTGTSYELARSWKRFPELKDKGDWDFIATPSRDTGRWLAVEVKSHVDSEVRRGVSGWESICNDVEDALVQAIPGSFVVIPDTRGWFPSRRERPRLTASIVAALTNALFALETGGACHDLGPAILKRFPQWPVGTPRGRFIEEGGTKQYIVEYPAREFAVFKTDDAGHEFGLGAFVGGVFSPEAVDNTWLDSAVSKGEIQLARAKAKGAFQAILVLDEGSGHSVEALRTGLSAYEPNDLESIDVIYGVKLTDTPTVLRVWP